MATDDENRRTLREAALYYYEVCELYEDEDLDPDDHLEVVARAFTSSDCDAFAHVLSAMTGWERVTFTWQVPDWGCGHHTLVRSPEGRLLDARGWTDLDGLRKRYGAKSGTLGEPRPYGDIGPVDDEGFDEDLRRVAGVIRALPQAPYQEEAFKTASARPVPGVDEPYPDEEAAPPSP